MKNGLLLPGLSHEFSFKVPRGKTVPCLYPESSEFGAMPEVFATGYMVGLIEWACIRAVNPYLDWPKEQTVGTHVNLSHIAPTPPGLTVSVRVRLTAVEGRRLVFSVEASDGIDKITEGSHERFVINATKFNERAKAKAGQIS